MSKINLGLPSLNLFQKDKKAQLIRRESVYANIKREIDVASFTIKDFDPIQFLNMSIQSNTEVSINQLQQELFTLKERLECEGKKELVSNYVEVEQVLSEVVRIRDMEDMKKGLKQINDICEYLARDLMLGDKKDPLMLTGVQGVEVIPRDPTRALLLEGSGLSLISGKEKKIMNASVYLFTDLIMLSAKRNKQKTLIAWFPVGSEMEDINETRFSLRDKESIVVECESEYVKRHWMNAISKAEKDYGYASSLHSALSPTYAPSFTPSHTIIKEIDEESIENQLLDLADEQIACCMYDDAIGTIKRLIQLEMSPSIVKALVEKISLLLRKEITNPLSSKTALTKNVGRLKKLGLQEMARDTFLKSRAEYIERKTRKLRFEGTLVKYISDLSFLVFSILRNTCDWYSASFESSSFIVWASNEIKKFCNVFRRQVLKSPDFMLINECMIALQSQTNILKEASVDLSFLIDGYFSSDIDESLKQFQKNFCSEMQKASERQKATAEPEYSLLISLFQSKFNELIEHAFPLVSDNIFDTFVSVVCSTCDSFYKEMLTIVDLEIVTACQQMTATFIPSKLNSLKTGKAFMSLNSVPEFKELLEHLKNITDVMTFKFIEKKMTRFEEIVHAVDYSSNEEISDSAVPSEYIITILDELNKIYTKFSSSKRNSHKIIVTFLEKLADLFEREHKVFGWCGIQQMVLDMHYFCKECEFFLATVEEKFNRICANGLAVFFKQHGNKQLKEAEWYDRRVLESYNGSRFQKKE